MHRNANSPSTPPAPPRRWSTPKLRDLTGKPPEGKAYMHTMEIDFVDTTIMVDPGNGATYTVYPDTEGVSVGGS